MPKQGSLEFKQNPTAAATKDPRHTRFFYHFCQLFRTTTTHHHSYHMTPILGLQAPSNKCKWEGMSDGERKAQNKASRAMWRANRKKRVKDQRANRLPRVRHPTSGVTVRAQFSAQSPPSPPSPSTPPPPPQALVSVPLNLNQRWAVAVAALAKLWEARFMPRSAFLRYPQHTRTHIKTKTHTHDHTHTHTSQRG